jgi:hypothetical protein
VVPTQLESARAAEEETRQAEMVLLELFGSFIQHRLSQRPQ